MKGLSVTGPTGGGTRLRVVGAGFAAAPANGSLLRCAIRGTVSVGTLLADGALRCDTPPSSYGSATLAVALNGADFSAPLPFAFYEEPRLASVAPVAALTSGGATVRLCASSPLPLLHPSLAACQFGGAAVRAAALLSVAAHGATSVLGAPSAEEVAASHPIASHGPVCGSVPFASGLT